MTRPLTCACLMIVAAGFATARGEEPAGEGPAAADLLNAGLSRAKKDGTRVFLLFGATGCEWCKVFDTFHDDPAVKAVLGRHVLLVKVDTARNPGGEAMYNLYGSHRGVPAWSILDAEEKLLADSGDGTENVGFPFKPNEVEHYVKALRKACPRLTNAEVDVLRKKLVEVRPKAAG
jgi:hypothetical protein